MGTDASSMKKNLLLSEKKKTANDHDNAQEDDDKQISFSHIASAPVNNKIELMDDHPIKVVTDKKAPRKSFMHILFIFCSTNHRSIRLILFLERYGRCFELRIAKYTYRRAITGS